MQIMLPKELGSAVAEVIEVLSDTQLRIKREFGGDKVTTKLAEQVEGVTYKTMPYVDQQDMYRHVYDALQNDGCIGIYPEGECSHS